MQAHAAVKAKLEERRAVLAHRIAEAERELDQPGDPQLEDQASGRQGDEVIETLEDAALAELRQIDHALARIEAGAYGTCTACGGPIAPKRLEALPHAETCVACA